MGKHSQSIEKEVLSRIYGRGRGVAFTPKEFRGLGSQTAIAVTLHTLAKKGVIRRLARGLYDYPKTSDLVGLLPPNPESIARALAGSEGLRLQPAGALSANLLGLSEQVPARAMYLTDAPSRTVRVGRQTVILRQTTPRNMKLHNRISGLVIQALRHLGKKNVGAEQIAALRGRLSLEQRSEIASDAKWAPAWIAEIMRAMARDH